MNIIWETPTDEMHERYLILELEPHNIEGEMKDTWCVIEADKISMGELTMIEHWKKLHNDFVQANRNKDAKLCTDLKEHLIGKFAGEMDTFYEEICKRHNQATKIVLQDQS